MGNLCKLLVRILLKKKVRSFLDYLLYMFYRNGASAVHYRIIKHIIVSNAITLTTLLFGIFFDMYIVSS